MEKHFSILSCVELILKGFSNPVLLMSCPQGPFGSWKFEFFDFQALCPVAVPAGALLSRVPPHEIAISGVLGEDSRRGRSNTIVSHA